MIGISGPEFLVIILVAVIVVGPQRLPEYARKLTQAVRRLRVFLDDAKEQIAEEVGPEMADLNLSDLDPRNYDPRKIVRDALGEDLDAIRKDLANPFQSVAKTAKETADDIVRPGATKSLTQMIDAKAEQTRRTRKEDAAQTGSGGSAGSRGDGATSGTGDGQDDVEQSAAEAESAAEAGGPARAESAAEAPAQDEARKADAAEEPDAPSSGVDEPTGAPEEPEAPGMVPSSLVAGSASEAAPRIRPVSPREIVRAANAAARTRAEAASAVIDI